MKKFLAVIAGLTVAFTIITVTTLAVIKFFGTLYPLNGTELTPFIEMIRSVPALGLILIIVGHALGSLAGGVTVGRILKADTMNVGLTLGAVLTILGLVNMVLIPTYPEWFYLDFIVFIPCSMGGANYTSKL